MRPVPRTGIKERDSLMADKTKIQWTQATWNPIAGCTKCSPGCDNCYAERMAGRLANMDSDKYTRVVKPQLKPCGPLWQGKWNNKIYCDEKSLDIPLHWRKPRMVFVNSMSDTFHEKVPFEFIVNIHNVAYEVEQHTYQVLTKRIDRALEYYQWLEKSKYNIPTLPNLWLGVTVCTQKEADEKIPILLQIPAAVRFVSIEPMLEEIRLKQSWLLGYDFSGGLRIEKPRLDQIILGGESGPKARPMHPDWARSIRDQCVAAGVPFFFKQWGEYGVYGPNQHFDVLHWRTKKIKDAYKLLHPTDCCIEGWTDGSMPVNPKEVKLVKRDVKIVAVNRKTGEFEEGPGMSHRAAEMARVGKKKAGCLLDGREWKQYPLIAKENQ